MQPQLSFLSQHRLEGVFSWEGRPVEALCLAAIGIKTLSMRPASIGPVKNVLLKSDLGEVQKIIDKARVDGETTLRKKVIEYLAKN